MRIAASQFAVSGDIQPQKQQGVYDKRAVYGRDRYNEEFWCALDELVANSEIVIDRPKGTAHPRFIICSEQAESLADEAVKT